MSDTTTIEWTDSTFNGWRGCTPLGLGCDHCYAAALSRRTGGPDYRPGAARRRTGPDIWRKPARWNSAPFYRCTRCAWRGAEPRDLSGAPRCQTAGCAGDLVATRRRVFSLSLGDWLDNEVPIEWFVDLMELIRRTPGLDWQLLTKRIGNWRRRLLEALDWIRHELGSAGVLLAGWLQAWLDGQPPSNVWVGATFVDQVEMDRDYPKLASVPGRVHFASIEPMLGAIALPEDCAQTLQWVIVGGESGHQARPMDARWVTALRDQCERSGIAFMFKQWGEWLGAQQDGAPDRLPVILNATAFPMRVGRAAAGRRLDSRTHDDFPGDL